MTFRCLNQLFYFSSIALIHSKIILLVANVFPSQKYSARCFQPLCYSVASVWRL